MLKLWRLSVAIIGSVSLSLLAYWQLSANSQEHPGCFMVDKGGELIDLSLLCPSPAEPEEPTLGTGDVQVTLRWSTADDLDLAVKDPSGEIVSYQQSEIASGGELDVDSNAGCGQTTTNPVENVFWPTGGAPTGEYEVQVNLFQRCNNSSGPIEYTVTLLVKGNSETKTGTVDDNNSTVTIPLSVREATE
ncbi:hypothetical protein [Phormidium sp. CCY1219]|jgi:hypothetical protein|uniref:hypothetical protein n=1 Tax=Phormidium sp. CCY1219 TaxID=2886104 RepID=UPI002D1EC4BB|nr:hypothetical protein [Phormidium sp. CCY1219]MEB3828128.1 hypothetical protein [Phormidium sp. CCY1219]